MVVQQRVVSIWHEQNKEKQNQKVINALIRLVVIGYQHKKYKLIDILRLDLVSK
jgi:hypothetical protein